MQCLLGNMVTVMSPDGNPIQVNASALQAAAVQNTVGTLEYTKIRWQIFWTRIVNLRIKGIYFSNLLLVIGD